MTVDRFWVKKDIALSVEDKNWSGSFKSAFRVIFIFFAIKYLLNNNFYPLALNILIFKHKENSQTRQF